MKICYLSSTELGKEMLKALSQMECEIVYSDVENQKVSNFADMDYELGISFLYTHKIPKSEFERKKTWINFHPGPLPEYKGRNLCYHAIMNQEKEFGATIHYMDERFDSGPIIEVKKFSIENYDTAGDLTLKSRDALCSLFKEYIPIILKGEIVNIQPQSSQGRYFKKTAINNEISLTESQLLQVRALTAVPIHFPQVLIGGKKYLLVPDGNYNSSQ